MKVEIFTLCDFAQTDSSGKLTIVGTFDSILSEQMPAIHGLCCLAIKMRFDKIEEGLKKIKISIIDADGKSIMPPVEGQFEIRQFQNNPHATAQVIFLIPQIQFPKFGEYAIDLAIDGRQEASTPLYVRQKPMLPPHLQTPP